MVLKGMNVVHNGRPMKRYVYLGNQSSCVLIARHWYQVKHVGIATYQTERELSEVEANLIQEQAEA